MTETTNPGKKFFELLEEKEPLQIVGCINAYCAVMAEKVGHKSIYLSGAGVANASFGIPDLGITNLGDVVEDAKRITSVTDVPLLVDIDTGWGGAFNISRTIKELSRAGVAAVHIEDQVGQKDVVTDQIKKWFQLKKWLIELRLALMLERRKIFYYGKD